MPTTKKPPVPIYADTSFLYSLYLQDANNAAVKTYVKAHAPSLAFTAWQRCELRNALRLAVARGNASAADSQQALVDLEADVANGDLVETTLVWPDVLATAEALSGAHTMALAVRTLDLLHVAAAF